MEEIKIKRKPGMPVFENPGVPTALISPEQVKKHEEIKRMAREIYLDSCWERAEEFYEYAKEKEEAK